MKSLLDIMADKHYRESGGFMFHLKSLQAMAKADTHIGHTTEQIAYCFLIDGAIRAHCHCPTIISDELWFRCSNKIRWQLHSLYPCLRSALEPCLHAKADPDKIKWGSALGCLILADTLQYDKLMSVKAGFIARHAKEIEEFEKLQAYEDYVRGFCAY